MLSNLLKKCWYYNDTYHFDVSKNKLTDSLHLFAELKKNNINFLIGGNGIFSLLVATDGYIVDDVDIIDDCLNGIVVDNDTFLIEYSNGKYNVKLSNESVGSNEIIFKYNL